MNRSISETVLHFWIYHLKKHETSSTQHRQISWHIVRIKWGLGLYHPVNHPPITPTPPHHRPTPTPPIPLPTHTLPCPPLLLWFTTIAAHLITSLALHAPCGASIVSQFRADMQPCGSAHFKRRAKDLFLLFKSPLRLFPNLPSFYYYLILYNC